MTANLIAKVERAGDVGFVRQRSAGGLAGCQRRSGDGVDQRGMKAQAGEFQWRSAGAQRWPPGLISLPRKARANSALHLDQGE